MKHLKSKLMVAIAMLCISAVMLTGVSFAWYTLSTNPEVKGVTTSVSANENLEIALDNGYTSQTDVDTASANAKAGGAQGSTSGNPYTWGNFVDLTYAYGEHGINGQLSLKPVSYKKTGDVATLQFPEYGDNGRILDQALKDLKGFSISDLDSLTSSSNPALQGSDATDHNGVVVYGQKTTQTDNATFDAMSVTYWLRSNMDTNVSLSAATKRASSSEDSDTTNSDPNDVQGSGSYLRIPSTTETATAAAAANTKIYSWLTSGKLTIQFDVITVADNKVTETFYAYPTATAAATLDSGYYTYALQLNSTKTSKDATAPTISLTANTAKTIVMYVYLDGAYITNADALVDDLTGMELNIQFAGTDINDAMDVE